MDPSSSTIPTKTNEVRIFVTSLSTEPIVRYTNNKFLMVREKEFGIGRCGCILAITYVDGRVQSTPIPCSIDKEVGKVYVLDTSISRDYLLEQGNASKLQQSPTIDLTGSPIVREPTTINLEDSPPPNTQKKQAAAIVLDAEEEMSSGMPTSTHSISVVEYIRSSGGRHRVLHHLLQNTLVIERVEEVPALYNGNVAFELPVVADPMRPMEGMEQKYDGHCWTKPTTTSMKFPGTVRRSKCVGEVECPNKLCSGRLLATMPNRTAWAGHTNSQCNPFS